MPLIRSMFRSNNSGGDTPTPPTPATKYGLTIDNLLGDVDENGVLQNPDLTGKTFDLSGVKHIDNASLRYGFYDKKTKSISRFSAPDLESISLDNAMSYCFYNNYGLTSVDLSALKTISGSYAISSCFNGCSNLISVDVSALTTLSSYGCCSDLFKYCTNLIEMSFQSLTTINGGVALSGCLSDCTKLIKVSFPALISFGSSNNQFGSASYNYIFSNCPNLTEIHFRADAQAAVEALQGYADKWGATNATIYFDL